MRRSKGLLMGALLLWGCATSSPTESPVAFRTHYTLKVGDPVPYPVPMPKRTDIKIDWHYSDGSVVTLDGFRGWDFNEDDRFEMVEVLGEDGVVQTRVFDFDGDGRIDLVK